MLRGTKYHISGDEDAGSMATTLGTLKVLDSDEEVEILHPAGKGLLLSKQH